jgi:hypothetical protein
MGNCLKHAYRNVARLFHGSCHIGKPEFAP